MGVLNLFGKEILLDDLYIDLQDKFDELFIIARMMGYTIDHSYRENSVGINFYLHFKNNFEVFNLVFKTNEEKVWRIDANTSSIYVGSYVRKFAKYVLSEDGDNLEKIYEQIEKVVNRL